MPLLTLTDASLAYGHHALLDKVNLQVDPGERICLVGRNGMGKSTLFRVISGQAQLDDGELWKQDTLKISYLEQEVPEDQQDTVFDVVGIPVTLENSLRWARAGGTVVFLKEISKNAIIYSRLSE